MSNREEKRRVLQQLHDMGFQANEISVAIRENGYNLERCTDYLVSRQQNARPRLHVGMEVWIYSTESEDWVPGHIVSITKQLVSIIFSGHDFRWLEKESDLFRIQDNKPEPFLISNSSKPNGVSPISKSQENDPMSDDKVMKNRDDNYMHGGYSMPRNDEIDYHVRFTESVLGLELYSDEDGFNCIVGRCVSNIARANVTPGSQIVQVNDNWLANFKFEEIRDAVKQAAKSPPLNVTFRIKRSVLNQVKNQSYQRNNNGNISPNPNENEIENQNQNQNGNHNSPHSNTTPEINDDGIGIGGIHSNNGKMKPVDDGFSHSDEKDIHPDRNQPPIVVDFANEDDTFEQHMTVEQAQKLRVGDYVDNRDDVGRFLLASVVDKHGSKLKIHYEGWNSKWDKWYDYSSELRKFAQARSISRKPNTRFPQLKIRDYVDINPLERHPGWRPGQIRRMDKYSGQSQIVYKEDGQEFLYWAHLNNPEEIAPFMTKSAETIAKKREHINQYSNDNNNYNDNNNNNDYNNNNNNNNINSNNNNNNNNIDNNENYSPNMNNTYSNSLANHNHKESMTFSQTSSRQRRPLPPTLQGRSLPPKPPRKANRS